MNQNVRAYLYGILILTAALVPIALSAIQQFGGP